MNRVSFFFSTSRIEMRRPDTPDMSPNLGPWPVTEEPPTLEETPAVEGPPTPETARVGGMQIVTPRTELTPI